MSRKIWKYVFPRGHREVKLMMPAGAEIVHVSAQGLNIVIHAIVTLLPGGHLNRPEHEVAQEPRHFECVYTGEPVPNGNYLGTATISSGAEGLTVWHVFETTPPRDWREQVMA